MRKWEKLPTEMRNEYVRYYYNILCKKRLSLILKRIFDIIVSALMLILFSWLFIILAIIIKIDSPGPVFYRQERVTRYGKHFRIHKFRTMVSSKSSLEYTVTVNDDDRITRVGRHIRKWRLDEISQLIDVFEGNMTFVATRAEAVKYVDMYHPVMWATLLLPAGVTSDACIYCIDDEDQGLIAVEDVDAFYVQEFLPHKMYYNLKELEEFSFRKDIITMIRTVLTVCGKRYEKNVEAEEKFKIYINETYERKS